ncbi:hypothetical protein ACFW61_35400 [Streptomyces microflavus]|uniref:hypothetical protein n=1 Tax=Streptomyces microflavus TaxID=1919 RepID=UPI0036AE6B10
MVLPERGIRHMSLRQTWDELLTQIIEDPDAASWRDFRRAFSLFYKVAQNDDLSLRTLEKKTRKIDPAAPAWRTWGDHTAMPAEGSGKVKPLRWRDVAVLARVWVEHFYPPAQREERAGALVRRWADAYWACGGDPGPHYPRPASPTRTGIGAAADSSVGPAAGTDAGTGAVVGTGVSSATGMPADTTTSTSALMAGTSSEELSASGASAMSEAGLPAAGVTGTSTPAVGVGEPGRLKQPDLAEGPLKRLNEALHDLHFRAGGPPLSRMYKAVSDGYVSRSRIHAVFTAAGLPAWEVVDTLVEILASMARDTEPEDEIKEFLRLWRAAAAVEHAVPAYGVTKPGPVTDRRAAEATTYLELACDATKLQPGHTLGLTYKIRMDADGPLPLMLGASLVGRDDREYYDKSGDLHVTISAGLEGTYHRPLLIPAHTPAGEYRLVGAVWYPRSGEQCMASVNLGYIVQITSQDGRPPAALAVPMK